MTLSANGWPVWPPSPSTLCTNSRLGLHRSMACTAPLRSVTSAVVTATACGIPCVSTAICRLMPETFFARVVALLLGAVCVLYALRINDQKAGHGVAPQFLAGLANGFF